jgi:hypothetical protein
MERHTYAQSLPQVGNEEVKRPWDRAGASGTNRNGEAILEYIETGKRWGKVW